MPIVIVKFKEPIAFTPRPRKVEGSESRDFFGNPFHLTMFFADMVFELTLVVERLPQLVYPRDGDSKRGYLDFGNGVDFDARNIEDVRIIL